jgi:hypothetical protein
MATRFDHDEPKPLKCETNTLAMSDKIRTAANLTLSRSQSRTPIDPTPPPSWPGRKGETMRGEMANRPSPRWSPYRPTPRPTPDSRSH